MSAKLVQAHETAASAVKAFGVSMTRAAAVTALLCEKLAQAKNDFALTFEALRADALKRRPPIRRSSSARGRAKALKWR